MMSFSVAIDMVIGLANWGVDKDKHEIESLPDEEKKCYKKIVQDLQRLCQERLEDSDLAPRLKSRVLAIIFRQSESWRNVESLLNKVKTNTLNPEIEKWAAKWSSRITSMREKHHEIIDFVKDLRQCKEDLRNSLNDEDSQQLQAKEERIKKQIAKARIAIHNHLQNGGIELVNDLKNKALKQNKASQDALRFLETHWLHLSVFSEWPEVSMDEKKLNVKVYHPKKAETNADKYLNMSTKAIFFIEDNIEETEARNVEGGKYIRPTGMSLQRKCYGPSTPSVKRRSSSVVFTEEIIYDVQVGDKDNSQKLQEKEKAITSQAQKIGNLVTLALNTVNKNLTQNHLDDLGIENDDWSEQDPISLNERNRATFRDYFRVNLGNLIGSPKTSIGASKTDNQSQRNSPPKPTSRIG